MGLNALAERDVMIALQVLPEDMWETHDDKCDCTYQRIGFWTNPYIAETLEVRMCCIWRELYQLFPQHVRNTAAYYDSNRDEWIAEPQEWNGEDEMPKAMWYRQLARKEGITVGDARAKYGDLDYLRPRGTPRPPVEPPVDPIALLFGMVEGLAEFVNGIASRLDAAGLASVLTGEDSDSGAPESDDPRADQVGDGEVAS